MTGAWPWPEPDSQAPLNCCCKRLRGKDLLVLRNFQTPSAACPRKVRARTGLRSFSIRATREGAKALFP